MKKEDILSTRCCFPQRMMLEVTNICNNKCIFCASQCSARKRGIIEEDLAFRLLKEAYIGGVRDVGFHGMGEPLLCKELGKYVKYAKELGYTYIYIDTNGILATPEIINPVIDAGLDSIKFSIHAISSDVYQKVNRTDNFEKVMKNIQHLYEYKVSRHLQLKLITFFAETTLNTQEKECFQTEMSKYGEVWISPIHNGSGVLEEQNSQIAVTDNIKCYQGSFCREMFERIVISWNGDCMACCTDWTGSLVYGNVRDASLEELWNNEKMQNIRESMLSGNLPDICKKCVG